jgi:hypothetical protein
MANETTETLRARAERLQTFDIQQAHALIRDLLAALATASTDAATAQQERDAAEARAFDAEEQASRRHYVCEAHIPSFASDEQECPCCFAVEMDDRRQKAEQRADAAEHELDLLKKDERRTFEALQAFQGGWFAEFAQSGFLSERIEGVLRELDAYIENYQKLEARADAAEARIASLCDAHEQQFIAREAAEALAAAYKRDWQAELDGNAALRLAYGARDDETMFGFLDRLKAEKDAAKARCQEYGQHKRHCWKVHEVGDCSCTCGFDPSSQTPKETP